MTTPQFPLTEALGVALIGRAEHASTYAERGTHENVWYVRAADLERVLASAPVVWGSPDAVRNTPLAEVWYADTDRGHTHTARLVCVQPIVRDTAESLLRELAEAEARYRKLHDYNGSGNLETGRAWDEMRRIGDRARALLERQGGSK